MISSLYFDNYFCLIALDVHNLTLSIKKKISSYWNPYQESRNEKNQNNFCIITNNIIILNYYKIQFPKSPVITIFVRFTMSQHFLTNFSIVLIKHYDLDNQYLLSNKSFVRSSIFLAKDLDEKYFENSLFYVEFQGNNRQFKIPLEFHQKIFFRHKVSNKYLSFSEHFEQQQNDTTYKLELSHKKCFFKILPCFQYQTKISNKVKFNEDIYLATQINSTKVGYISTRPQSQQTLRMLVGLNYKSKFFIKLYYQCQKDEQHYTYGSVAWLSHIQSQGFLRTIKNPYTNKIDIGYDTIQFDNYKQQPTGLWLIQSEKIQQGGKLAFHSKFKLKNIATGLYLSFSKTNKMKNNEQYDNYILQQNPTIQSHFNFSSLKGQENYIKKGSYLIFRHFQSKMFMACRNKVVYENLQMMKPIANSDFDDEDLFKILEINESQQEAIRFIFSTKEELENTLKANLADKVIEFSETIEICDNTKKQLMKLKEQDKDLFQKVQIKMGEQIQLICTLLEWYNSKVAHANSREKSYELIKIIGLMYQIILILCRQCKQNQVRSYKFLKIYVQHIFMSVGAQEVIQATFKNNYTLLCKISDPLPELNNQNIIKAILGQVKAKKGVSKDARYWQNLNKSLRILQTVIFNHESTIDINQWSISEQLFQNSVFQQIFFDMTISKQRIKILLGKNYFDIEQIKEKQLLIILENAFSLFSSLCANRNFIAKKYVHQLLNSSQEKDGISVLIAYLNIPLSNNLSNSLYSLITNLYIDSSPRINRYKPLKIVNFALTAQEQNKSSIQEAEISGRLNQALLNKASQAYVSRPLNMSNIVNLIKNLEPTLAEGQMNQYKEQLYQKIQDDKLEKQILRSMSTLIQLESYEANQITQIFNLLCSKLNEKISESSKIGIMHIFQDISVMSEQSQLNKFSSYLKYKFRSIIKEFTEILDISYCIPGSSKLSELAKANIRNENLAISVKKYNDQLSILEKWAPRQQLKQKLIKLFIECDQRSSFDLLKENFNIIVKFCLPKQNFLQNLMQAMLITSEQVIPFENLFDLYKKIKHLASISQHWLSQNVDHQSLLNFLYYGGQIINNFHNGYNQPYQKQLASKQHKPIEVIASQISIAKQLLIKNFGFHDILFDMLETNYYLLETKKRNQIQTKHLKVFKLCFEFFFGFCYDCQQNKKVLSDYWHVLNKFRSLVEVGQTKLFNVLYEGQNDYIRSIKSNFIEQMILKIIKNSKEKKNQNCQFDPEYLSFFEKITKMNGKPYKPNLQRIYRFLEKQNVLKRILFVQEKDSNTILCLDAHKFRNDPVQVPFLYHAKILNILNKMIQHLESQSTILKSKIYELFSLDYLLSILHLPDIYTHFGIQAQMNFLVKKQIYKFIMFHLQKSDVIKRLHKNYELTLVLTYFQTILIAKKPKASINIDNETLYLPFLKRQKQTIQFYETNLRTHFLEDIKPFLLKLISVFNKTAEKEDKNLPFMIEIMKQTKPQQLSQNYDFKNKSSNLNFVKFKWRNFIDQQHSEEQRFAKGIILKILQSSYSGQLLKKERQSFFSYFSKDINNSIRAITQLLKLNMDLQLTENDSEESLKDILKILKIIYKYIDEQNDDKIKNQIIASLHKFQIINILIDFTNKPSFEFTKNINRKILAHILRIFNFMIEADEDNKTTKILYKIFNQDKKCYRFFNHVKDAIGMICQRLDGTKAYQHINNAISQVYFCVEDSNQIVDEDALDFLRNLCNYPPFTSFLRYQPTYPSTDFLEKIFTSFKYVLYRQQQKIKLSISSADAGEDLLQVITAMMTGGNKANQDYIIDNKLPEIVNEALKINQMKCPRSKVDIAESQRLLEEVIEFYQLNGVKIGTELRKKLEISDFYHPYILNRFKYTLLKTLMQCLAGNEKSYPKIRIQIPIQVLKINLIWVYEDFIQGKYEYEQAVILRQKAPWSQVVSQGQNLKGLFLATGFYFYSLIQILNQNSEQKSEQQQNLIDDQQKEKKKLVMKFFNSISQKQKQNEKIKKIQQEPYGQQIKLFYEKYYQSLQFFRANTRTVEINFNNSLTKAYFPKLPICDKFRDDDIQRFKQEAERISQEEKIKSLLEFENSSYSLLNGQEEFFNSVSNKIWILGHLLSYLNENVLILIGLFSCILITVFYLLDNFYFRTTFQFNDILFFSFESVYAILIFILQSINFVVAFFLAVYLFSRKIPITINLLNQQQQERTNEQKLNDGLSGYKAVYVGTRLFSQIAYTLFLIIFLLLSVVHPLFAGFILLEIMNRIKLGRQIIRSIRQAWFQLLAATFLLIFFNYIYAVYIFDQWTDFYGPTCQSVYQCVLFLVDQALKSDSGFLGSVPITYEKNVFNLRFFSQVLYIVFAQKVVFDIFSGTIIDKFSQIRQENQAMQEDEASLCYICGQQRFAIDFELQGFEQHTQVNHNPIHYIFYLFYLRRKSKKQYGIVDKFVNQAQLKKKTDWIPNDTSLSKVHKQGQTEQQDEQDEHAKHKQQYEKKIKDLKQIQVNCDKILAELRNEIKS